MPDNSQRPLALKNVGEAIQKSTENLSPRTERQAAALAMDRIKGPATRMSQTLSVMGDTAFQTTLLTVTAAKARIRAGLRKARARRVGNDAPREALFAVGVYSSSASTAFSSASLVVSVSVTFACSVM